MRLLFAFVIFLPLIAAQFDWIQRSNVRPDGYDLMLQTDSETREESAQLVNEDTLKVEGIVTYTDPDGKEVLTAISCLFTFYGSSAALAI